MKKGQFLSLEQMFLFSVGIIIVVSVFFGFSKIGDDIKHLSEKDKKVMELYFFGGLTHNEIGKELGVTRSRAHQRYHDSIRQLKKKLLPLKEKV